ncbi:MAG: response regulator [Thermoflexaceae bacterium]|nr:response regulator [Thermoflexaceae bacterium]
MPARRILLAEDEQTISKLIQKVLAAAGHDVVGVTSAAEAIERLAGNGWDLLLLDLNLDDGDGLPVIDAIARLGKHPPVVVMTGESDFEDGATAGPVAGVLRKPFDLDELERIVERYGASA